MKLTVAAVLSVVSLVGQLAVGRPVAGERGVGPPRFILSAGAAGAGPVPEALFAYASGGAAPAQGDCPATSHISGQCSLALALSLSRPGDDVELATPGNAAPYVGNWSVLTPGTSAQGPVTIEPSGPGVDPVLSGNDGKTAGCGTSRCDGPVLTVGPGAHLDLRGLVFRAADDITSGLGGAVQNVRGGVVTISGAMFIGNRARANGGAIDNADISGAGTLIVSASGFLDNTAVNGDGGAIANADVGGTGEVSVSECTFSDNGALNGDGGAIDNGDTGGTGTLHVRRSTFDQNAAGRAGAIDNADNGTGTVTVAGSSFTTDVAALDDAGGIDNADWGGHGTAYITTSTFAGDDTIGNGGAVDNADSQPTSRGTVLISDSTFYGDTADGYGGAIDTGDGGKGTVDLWASTLSGNTANNLYGGFDRRGGSNVHNGPSGTVWTAANLTSGPCRTDRGDWHDDGYNVADGGTCLFGGPHDIRSDNEWLGRFGNNGGPTSTLLPTKGNPAIGSLPYGATAQLGQLQVQLCPTTDQRGAQTQAGRRCDTGAVQL